MNKLKLTKIIVLTLTSLSLFSLNPLKSDATWQQDSNGWWNSEGNSWSTGWRYINDNWYYFGLDGYMKTGWILNNNKWYYLYNNGKMATDTTVGEYTLGPDGAWIEHPSEEPVKNEAVENESSNEETEQEIITDTSSLDNLTSALKSKGYSLELDDAPKDHINAVRKVFKINDDEIRVYLYTDNSKMEKDSQNISSDGFRYSAEDDKYASITNLYWPSYPHFYKTGNIIVNYIGTNSNIISDLNKLFGKQFAGIKLHNYNTDLSRKDIIEKIYDHLSSDDKDYMGPMDDVDLYLKTLDGSSDLLTDKSYPQKIQYTISTHECAISTRIDNYEAISWVIID